MGGKKYFMELYGGLGQAGRNIIRQSNVLDYIIYYTPLNRDVQENNKYHFTTWMSG